jgi:hypothetical protein
MKTQERRYKTMMSKRIIKAEIEIEEATDKLRENGQISEGFSDWIAALLDKLHVLAILRYFLQILFAGILYCGFLYLQRYYVLQIPLDKIFKSPSQFEEIILSMLSVVTTAAIMVILFGISVLLLKAPFHFLIKSAIGKLGKAARVQEPLRSLFMKHFVTKKPKII